MTGRGYFDRLAQPQRGEPLVLAPAAAYFPAAPEPLAPVEIADAEPHLSQAAPMASSPAARAAPTPPMLSPASPHIARKAAAPATPPPIAPAVRARPFAAAAPAQPAETVAHGEAAAAPLSSPSPGATPDIRAPDLAAPAYAAAGSRGTHSPLSTPVAPSEWDAAVVPEPLAPPASPLSQDPEPAPLRPVAPPAADIAPPRRPDTTPAVHPAAREPASDFGLAGLERWLGAVAAPAPASKAPITPAGIHIGVVEVRVSTPPPAPQAQQRAPALAPAVQPALARGYGWRFGLGQS